VLGEYNQATSEGIVTAAFTANTVESEEINVPNFAGKRCVYEPAVPELAGYGVDLTFCNVDFEFFEIITKQTLVFAADGSVVGLEADTKIALDDEGFALETWTGTVGADVCDDPDAEGAYGYLLLPLLKGGILGDFSVENGAVNFTITGASTREGNQWGNGPYAVEMNEDGDPDVLFQSVSKTAALDPTKVDFTSIAGIEGAVPLETEFTTTPAATGPVWWDFGDGEWDYVAAPGATDHLYAAAGTYTVLASQNGLVWTSVDITVPWP
jgi:hypothetical protein